MSWIVLGVWTVLAGVIGYVVFYGVGWQNWAGNTPISPAFSATLAFAFIFGLGLVHWRKLRKYD